MKNKAVMVVLLFIMLLSLVGCNGGTGKTTKSSTAIQGDTKTAVINENTKLKTAADLKNKRIGVLLGSIHDGYVTKTYPQAQLLQYKSSPDLILGVKSGKVDAAFYNRETLIEVFRNDNELAFLEERVYSTPIGIGFNKQNSGLREQFNAFLKQSKENGVYDDMVNRWINNGVTDMPVIDNPKTNGVLIVGMVSDKGLPFAIVKDNKLVGFDVELSERFAAYLGKELKPVDTEFGSLVTAVATKKIDMIASSMMITEERKQQIDFSDPYYELGASVFALKKNIAKYDEQPDTAAAIPLIKNLSARFHNNIIRENRYLLIFDGLKTTAVIALAAAIFGTLLGALVCFMRMSRTWLANTIARFYISIMRGIPVLVLLMIIFYVVFASVDISPILVAVLAFGMNFAAYVSEMFRMSIESIDKGQTEAGIAGGFTKTQTFFYIIMPQAIRRVLPVYKGELISLVKMTSIVGYIAVQDLTKASDIIRSRTFDAFFPLIMVAVLYFLVSWSLALVLDYMEARSNPKRNRNAGRVTND
ncbi:Inner membrane amino-acid ABC transporter permease protein YecS [Sporomusa ovata DSM 2662]|uniref:Polar amino acid ABC transporter, inner membrane subunit n=1 Tax=Sporomusa ovata TaxID=2378 RepID=A0A0U1KZD5_9FIRM|nr:ABC transporter substrate-binding protein/permease [Sporomusa ovata]EQB29514.1 polar amino acid ABC transporter, inner membrane subunit [Sporomusa ovata DSM 2662]CQR72024.1 polar amino acid ABC transporter, inner membrane subunit [Sporomusa ovata]